MGEIPQRVVFDAEPLVAHADNERGAETVDQYIDAVRNGKTTGWISVVNYTEIRYWLVRKYDQELAEYYLERLRDRGIQSVDADEAAATAAAEFVIEYNPFLGDAFALATAEALDATLLVGGDSDFDGVTEVPIVHFREGSD